MIPSSLTATAVSPASVKLVWSPPCPTLLDIEYKKSDSALSPQLSALPSIWAHYGQAAINSTAALVNHLDPSTTYKIRIGHSMNSNWSPTATISTPAAPPIQPAAPGLPVLSIIPPVVNDRAAKVHVAFPSNSNGTEDGFVIQRSTDNGATWNEAGRTGKGIVNFDDLAAPFSTALLYRVAALKA